MALANIYKECYPGPRQTQACDLLSLGAVEAEAGKRMNPAVGQAFTDRLTGNPD